MRTTATHEEHRLKQAEQSYRIAPGKSPTGNKRVYLQIGGIELILSDTAATHISNAIVDCIEQGLTTTRSHGHTRIHLPGETK